MRARWFRALAAGALVLTCGAITAQENATKTATKAQEKKQQETISGRADYMRSTWGDKRTVLMKGNVKFVHGNTTMVSDKVEYDEESRIASSPGKLSISDPECDITGDRGSADFRKRIGVVEGNVVLLVKPKKTEQDTADSNSVKSKLKESTTITCDRLEYNYRTKVATITGNVVFKQTGRSATAQKAVYDDKKQFLTLSGNVKGIDEKGQTFAAPDSVVISLKKGEEWIEAPNASATFKIDVDEEEKGQ